MLTLQLATTMITGLVLFATVVSGGLRSPFNIGDHVLGLWENHYYPCWIEAKNDDGTYKILWTQENMKNIRTHYQPANKLRITDAARIHIGTRFPDPSKVKRMLVTYHPPAVMPKACPLPKDQVSWTLETVGSRPGFVGWSNTTVSVEATVAGADAFFYYWYTLILYADYISKIWLTHRCKPFPINSGPQDWLCESGSVRWGVKVTLDDLDALEQAEVALCRHFEGLGLPPTETRGFLASDCPELFAKHAESLLTARLARMGIHMPPELMRTLFEFVL